ncbi:Na+/H+ antiporter subunit E [Roseococcus sp. DSY-14]|uniref:Na+/H+ antiporter subunit E n=1 Tax=Roseococcus sp. DSY-14 TaxID=3369650 RepID=UPI00387B68E9
MSRWLPFPLLALALLGLWLLLWQSASPGALVTGVLVALPAAATLRTLDLQRGGLRRLRPVPRLLAAVVVEVVRSNNAVARIILGLGGPGRRAGFVRVPLAMRSHAGLAALACILTATPGTVWVDWDEAEGTMLLHVLDMIGEDEWVRIVKERWERPLMEIFE